MFSRCFQLKTNNTKSAFRPFKNDLAIVRIGPTPRNSKCPRVVKPPCICRFDYCKILSGSGLVVLDNFLIFSKSFIRNLKSIRVVLPRKTCRNRREKIGFRVKTGSHVLKLINFFHILKRTYYMH